MKRSHSAGNVSPNSPNALKRASTTGSHCSENPSGSQAALRRQNSNEFESSSPKAVLRRQSCETMNGKKPELRSGAINRQSTMEIKHSLHRHGVTDAEISRFQSKIHEDASVHELSSFKAPEQRKLTQTNQFQCFIGSFIVLNAMCLGLEADYYQYFPTFFIVSEHTFTTVFISEAIARLVVEGAQAYFCNKLNCLDFFLAVTGVAQSWIIKPLGIDSDLRNLSVLRLLRLIRMTRLLKLFRLFNELGVLVKAFTHCIRTLFWSFFFLACVVYSFALFAHVVIGKKCADDGAEQCEPFYTFEGSGNANLTQEGLFGSVAGTMLTLGVCLTEGCGFDVIRPMTIQDPAISLFWLPFTMITTFGLMNLIIGLVCESSIATAHQAEEKRLRRISDQKERQAMELFQAFLHMDLDNSGEISKAEFTHATQTNPTVAKLLHDLGLGEETKLFETLDADGDSILTFDEFFDGVTLLMKGSDTCKAKDIVGVLLVCQSLQHRVRNLEATMVAKNDFQQLQASQEQNFQRLQAMISANTRCPSEMLPSETASPCSSDHVKSRPAAAKECIVKDVQAPSVLEQSIAKDVQAGMMDRKAAVDNRESVLEQSIAALDVKVSRLLTHLVCDDHTITPSEDLPREEVQGIASKVLPQQQQQLVDNVIAAGNSKIPETQLQVAPPNNQVPIERMPQYQSGHDLPRRSPLSSTGTHESFDDVASYVMSLRRIPQVAPTQPNQESVIVANGSSWQRAASAPVLHETPAQVESRHHSQSHEFYPPRRYETQAPFTAMHGHLSQSHELYPQSREIQRIHAKIGKSSQYSGQYIQSARLPDCPTILP